MELQSQLPVKALNQAYRKEPVNAQHFAQFKDCLGKLLKEIDEGEQEENTKNLVSDFLKDAFYKDEHHINTKGDIDLAIYHKNTQKSNIGVLIETKKPSNKGEMMSLNKPNQKALQQLVYYYLVERVEGNNLSLKYLIATDVYQWFVFDENQFEKWVYGNKKLVKKFKEARREGKPTSYFYKEVAQPLLDDILPHLTCTYFNLKEYRDSAALDYRSGGASTATQLPERELPEQELPEQELPERELPERELPERELPEQELPERELPEQELPERQPRATKRLIHLYKLLSPTHLLKKPFANDSNSLNREFYAELLHILGLEEVKEKNKKVIQRKNAKDRNAGSFIENTISKLERKRLYRVEGYEGYASEQERHEAIALELCITWVNRILFLKLLEAQLLQYHKGDKSYKFLNLECIHDFDALDDLFFGVLAKKTEERKSRLQEEFAHIPYLNSSLFEETILEAQTITAGNLTDEIGLPLHGRTILKDDKGKRRTGEEQPLNYLFQFLDAYNFASEGTEEIRKDNKSLINASVLGLIFEKINGYKDGSFYTPSFITMYMCRETLRRAAVQKFSEHYGKEFKNFEHLQDFLADKFSREERLEANQVLNSLKICDPAVGSGHFLVSALNELIAIKADLRLLADKDGARLPVGIRIENDELFVLEGGEADLFEYRVGDKESQNIQQTLFHEKQKLIEGCLFGVDINPNSVKICRLRLWIELLKNAYYTPESQYKELETLPNIDINIKAGNSLISRFALDADLGKALKKSKWNISSYRLAVQTYRNAVNKEEKRSMEQLMEDIKQNFRTEIHKNDPKKKKLQLAQGKLYTLLNQTSMFEQSKAEEKKRKAEQKKLEKEIEQLETEIEEIESNKIYENAFEWRFEFPEVLDEKGNFVGFDVVVGNPPYIRQEEISWMKGYLQHNYEVYAGTADLLVFFIEKGMNLVKPKGDFTFIIANKFMRAGFGKCLRQWMQGYQLREIIDFGDLPVFEEATTYPCILSLSREEPKALFTAAEIADLAFDSLEGRLKETAFKSDQSQLQDEGWNLANAEVQQLLAKLKSQGKPLGEYVDGKIYYGIKTGLNEAFVIDKQTKNRLIAEDPRSAEVIKPFLAGRDIKRYRQPVADKWLIFFPKGITIKRNLSEDDPNYIPPPNVAMAPPPRYGDMGKRDAWSWVRENYPAIAKHLWPFKKRAEKRSDKGDYWWELRACDYYGEFEKEKIIVPAIVTHASYGFDINYHYSNDKTNIIPVKDYFLLGIISSKTIDFFLKAIASTKKGGFYEYKPVYISKLPIANPTPIQQEQIETLVTQILNLKKESPEANTSGLEAEIDRLVYELYGLSEEEIGIVEGLG